METFGPRCTSGIPDDDERKDDEYKDGKRKITRLNEAQPFVKTGCCRQIGLKNRQQRSIVIGKCVPSILLGMGFM